MSGIEPTDANKGGKHFAKVAFLIGARWWFQSTQAHHFFQAYLWSPGKSPPATLLQHPGNDRSSHQRLSVERDCGIKRAGDLFASESDYGIDARGPARG